LDGPQGYTCLRYQPKVHRLTTYIAMLTAVTGQKDEQIALGVNELYVHYGEGMAQSKLKIPVAKMGAARNMNTVGKLAEMSGAV
jgi:uncharacterized protein (DUF1697 family)